jgi:hypothetical protein
MESIGQNSSLVEQIRKTRERFEAIVDGMRDTGSKRSLDQTERELFAEVLRLGRDLLSVHVAAQGDGHEGAEAKGPDGKTRPRRPRIGRCSGRSRSGGPTTGRRGSRDSARWMRG